MKDKLHFAHAQKKRRSEEATKQEISYLLHAHYNLKMYELSNNIIMHSKAF